MADPQMCFCCFWLSPDAPKAAAAAFFSLDVGFVVGRELESAVVGFGLKLFRRWMASGHEFIAWLLFGCGSKKILALFGLNAATIAVTDASLFDMRKKLNHNASHTIVYEFFIVTSRRFGVVLSR
jgi:hypothetical protein